MADNLDTPYSRREIFYKGILDQDPDSLPDPETREERYLKAIAEAYPTPVEATVSQDEGSSTTSVMSQKAVTDALDGLRDSKLDKTGTAPLADNLTPYSADSGATQSVPFNNQGTGCGNGESVVDTGSYAQVKKKLGNTVGVNQLCADETEGTSTVAGAVTKTVSNHKITFNGTATTDAYNAYVQYINAIVGHKYLLAVSISGTPAQGSSVWQIYTGGGFGNNYQIGSNTIFEAVSTSEGRIQMVIYNGTTIAISMSEPRLIDLTLWFGSNDRIPSDLLSHPENWGRYYAGSLDYNPGQLVNADGSVLTSIGRNCNSGDGDVLAIPNQAYYCKGAATITYKDRGGNTISTASVTNDSFTTPADCFSFGVSGTGVTISLYYSGESGYDSDYPFTVLAQIDTGSEVLRSAGAVADEKAPDGTITRRVGVVDLGTLTWTKYSVAEGTMFCTNVSNIEQTTDSLNIKCSKYATSTSAGRADKTVSKSGSTRVDIIDNSYSDAATFKAAMSGVYLYYELATPTTEQGTPFSGASADNFAIDDFGSMYWTQSAGVPQGVEIFYPYDYKAAVDTLLNMVDGDVEELVTETELGAVANRIPEAPAEDGTYTLKATVADGVKTYVWVADE